MPDRAVGMERRAARLRNGSDALAQAHGVMAAGCRFLMARAASNAAPLRSDAPYQHIRRRMLGNDLKELDRFLSVLIDECARLRGMSAARYEHFTQGTDTPLKLVQMERVGFSPHMPRLRAIGRLRQMACGKWPNAFGTRLRLDLAIAAGARREADDGATPPDLDDQVLADIAEFYLSLADVLYGLYAEAIKRP